MEKSMKMVIIFVVCCVLFGWIKYLQFNSNKVVIERKQLEELQRQNGILIDIANSLKVIVRKVE